MSGESRSDPLMQRAVTQLARPSRPGDPAPDDAPAAGPSNAKVDPLIGVVIHDRYRLIERVGEGGMGAVYRGEHIKLQKRVAVKFLHAEMSRIEDVVRRFEREAIAAANLEHPNVVAAHDFGTTKDGLFFLVMEYVDGGSLRDLLQAETRLAPARALHIAKHIASALNRAHAIGIVHRDLKPENVVLVEREGDRDFAKVIDFGIAKVAPDKHGGPALTQAGMVFGTPDYMAPEQALGAKVDHRADLYAFGIVVFELLVGRRPFVSDDVMQLLGQHMTATPPNASQLAPPGVIPPAADAVLGRMLSKSASERFNSASEFVDALAAAFGFAPLASVTGMTPPFGVGLPPASITGQLAAAAAATPAGGLAGPGIPASITGQQPTVDGGYEHVVPPGAVAPLGRTASVAEHATRSFKQAYADVRRDPQQSRVAAIGVAAFALLVVVGAAFALHDSPRAQPRVDTPTPHLPAAVVRETPLGPSEANRERRIANTAIALPTTEIAPGPAGMPSELAAQLAEYQARPNVAPLLRAAHNRQRAAVITAFEQTRAQAPQDPIVAYLLGTLYAQERGRGALAVERYGQALHEQPGFAFDPTLVHDVVRAYVDGRGSMTPAVDLITGPLASPAMPVLLEAASGGRSVSIRGRAADLLVSRAFATRLDPTTRGILELGQTRSCEQKRSVVERMGREADARALPWLRRIPVGRGCGFLGMGLCNPCLSEAVPAAIRSIESRGH